MIILSCGHEDDQSGTHETIHIKDHTKEGVRCVRIGVYCLSCVKRYMARGDVIVSDDEEKEWLNEK